MANPASRDLDDYRRRDTSVAAVMFGLSLLFLLLFAGLLYSHQLHSPDQQPIDAGAEEAVARQLKWDTIELRIQLYGMILLWPVFFLESLGTLLGRDQRQGYWRSLGWMLMVCLAPPTRIAGRITDKEIWLPRLGWRRVDRDLRRALERFFSVPMIVIALMVLPLLAIEYGWRSQVQASAGLRLFLEIGNSVIWMAFTVEFLVMISVAANRWRYCALHWVDLAIILLPVLFLLINLLPLAEFVPLARLTQLLRLNQLSRMGRVYRMQGLALKAWRAFLVLEIIQRLMGRTLEKQLKQLEELLAAKEEEVRELRDEIQGLKKQIAAKTVNARLKSEVHVKSGDNGRTGGHPEVEIDSKGNSAYS